MIIIYSIPAAWIQRWRSLKSRGCLQVWSITLLWHTGHWWSSESFRSKVIITVIYTSFKPSLKVSIVTFNRPSLNPLEAIGVVSDKFEIVRLAFFSATLRLFNLLQCNSQERQKSKSKKFPKFVILKNIKKQLLPCRSTVFKKRFHLNSHTIRLHR